MSRFRPLQQHFKLLPFAFIALLAPAEAWAINKCTGADGKVVFQDAPCSGRGETLDIRPATGPAPSNTSTTNAAGTATSTTKEGVFGESWQRRTYLENRGIPDAQAAISKHKLSCEQKQAELRAKQGTANNNLAGATFLQSIAAEMQAAATTCDTRARELSTELDTMKKELADLQRK